MQCVFATAPSLQTCVDTGALACAQHPTPPAAAHDHRPVTTRCSTALPSSPVWEACAGRHVLERLAADWDTVRGAAPSLSPQAPEQIGATTMPIRRTQSSSVAPSAEPTGTARRSSSVAPGRRNCPLESAGQVLRLWPRHVSQAECADHLGSTPAERPATLVQPVARRSRRACRSRWATPTSWLGCATGWPCGRLLLACRARHSWPLWPLFCAQRQRAPLSQELPALRHEDAHKVWQPRAYPVFSGLH